MPDPTLSGIPPGVDPSDWIQAQRLMSGADMMTQQALTPEQPQQFGRMAARVSPLSTPLKLMEAMLARKSFERGAGLSAQNYARALEAMSPTQTPDQSIPSSVPDVPGAPTTGVQSTGMLRAPPTVIRGGHQPSAWNPQGLPPAYALRLFQTDPKAYMSYLLGPEGVQTGRLAGMPTQEAAARIFSHANDTQPTQLANAAGVDARGANLAQLNKEQTITLRQGESGAIPDGTYDANGQPNYRTIRSPNLGQGEIPITDNKGDVIGSRAVPGHFPYASAEAYANEAGKSAAEARELLDQNARKYWERGVDLTPQLMQNPFSAAALAGGPSSSTNVAGAPTGAPPSAATGQNVVQTRVSGQSGPAPGPNPAAAPQNVPPTAQNAAPTAPRVPPGTRNYFGASPNTQQSTSQHEAQEKLAARGVEYQNELVDANNGALQMKQNLQELRNLATNVNPSANAEMRLKAAVWARAMGIDADDVTKFFGLNPGDAEAMEKLRATLATSGIKQITSRGTNLDLSTFMKANPNIGMTPQGFQKALDYMDRQADVAIDRFNDFHAYAGNHDASEWERGHTAQWNQTFLSNLRAGKYTLGANSSTTDAGSALRPNAQPTLAEVRAERARRAAAANGQAAP